MSRDNITLNRLLAGPEIWSVMGIGTPSSMTSALTSAGAVLELRNVANSFGSSVSRFSTVGPSPPNTWQCRCNAHLWLILWCMDQDLKCMAGICASVLLSVGQCLAYYWQLWDAAQSCWDFCPYPLMDPLYAVSECASSLYNGAQLVNNVCK